MVTNPGPGFGFKTANGSHPENPTVIPLTLDFTGGNTNIVKDLFQEMAALEIDFVQSIWIDNSTNGSAVSILIGGTLQLITARPNSQGVYPVIAPQGQLQISGTSAGGVKVPIILMSMMMPYVSWTV